MRPHRRLQHQRQLHPRHAPAAAAPAAPAPAPSLPDYYDGHATDTNGDGKVDDKDTPKWPDATGGAAGYWTTPAAAPWRR